MSKVSKQDFVRDFAKPMQDFLKEPENVLLFAINHDDDWMFKGSIQLPFQNCIDNKIN